MYVYKYGIIYVYMYGIMYVYMYGIMYVYMYGIMYVYMYGIMYVYMYGIMYVYMYGIIYVYMYGAPCISRVCFSNCRNSPVCPPTYSTVSTCCYYNCLPKMGPLVRNVCKQKIL